MLTAFLILLLFIFSGMLVSVWHTASIKAATRARLWRDPVKEMSPLRLAKAGMMISRYDWLAVPMGIAACGVLLLFIGARFAVAFGFVAGIIFWQIHEIWLSKKVNRMEEQLADLIDLMVSGLQAGAGAVSAMETALSEIGSPLGPAMTDVMGRLRLGDSPREVFENLADRSKLETFKIFAVTMAVHWETGGRLVPLLSTVGRTIRDRIEVMRNARLQSVQGKVSAIVFVIVSYVLAYAVWRYDPAVMENFLISREGSSMMSFLIVLQALGMIWIHRMTQLKY